MVREDTNHGGGIGHGYAARKARPHIRASDERRYNLRLVSVNSRPGGWTGVVAGSALGLVEDRPKAGLKLVRVSLPEPGGTRPEQGLSL